MDVARRGSQQLLGHLSSFIVHQLLDGEHLDPEIPSGVPQAVVEYIRDDKSSVDATDGIRHKAFVRLRFLDEVHDDMGFKKNLRENLKDGSVVNEDGSVESFVHVLSVNSFRRSLDIRKADTEAKWREYKEDFGIEG